MPICSFLASFIYQNIWVDRLQNTSYEGTNRTGDGPQKLVISMHYEKCLGEEIYERLQWGRETQGQIHHLPGLKGKSFQEKELRSWGRDRHWAGVWEGEGEGTLAAAEPEGGGGPGSSEPRMRVEDGGHAHGSLTIRNPRAVRTYPCPANNLQWDFEWLSSPRFQNASLQANLTLHFEKKKLSKLGWNTQTAHGLCLLDSQKLGNRRESS